MKKIGLQLFKYLVALFLFLVPTSVWAACSGSSPNLTAPTWADVAACHTIASAGDTITVTAGSYTVTANTQITKYVKIKAGSPGVTLTDNSCGGSCSGGTTDSMITITESASGHTEFSGFLITQGTAVHSNPSGVIFLQVGPALGILIHDNEYDNTNTSGDFIIAATNSGVIYKNKQIGDLKDSASCFNNSAFLRHKLRFVSNTTGVAGWEVVSNWGMNDSNGDKHLYVENNTLINVFESPDIDDDGQLVWRFNTLTNVGGGSHGVDTSGILGARLMEVYGNKYVIDTTPIGGTCGSNPPNQNNIFDLRGGTALIHHNIIPNPSNTTWGPKSAMTWHVEELQRNGGGYPCWGAGGGMANVPGTYPSPHNVGWGWINGTGSTVGITSSFQPPTSQTQDLEPTYVWSNRGTGNFDAVSLVDYGVSNPSHGCATDGITGPYASISTYVIENRDYYLDTDAPTGQPGGYTPYTCPHPWTGASGSCDLSTPGTDGYGVNIGSYTYHRAVTIDHTKVPSAQSEFTVLICANSVAPCNTTVTGLNQSGGGAHVTSSIGADLRPFLDNTCSTSPMFYKTERYNASTGEMLMWVKISALSNLVDTTFYLCYGNSAVTVDGSSPGAWDQFTQAAYLLSDGTTLSVADSGEYGNNATNNGATATTGQIDGGANFVKASSQTINTPFVDMSFGGVNNGTISWWSNTTGTFNDGVEANMWGQLHSASVPGLTCEKFSDNNIYCGWSGMSLDRRVVVAASSSNYPQNTWIKYDFTWTGGGSAFLYANGIQIGTNATQDQVQNVNSGFEIGYTTGGFSTYWNGKEDQFRISNVARSANWITTEYNNVNSPSTFSTIGGESSGGGATLSWSVQPTTVITGNMFSPVPAVTITGTTSVHSIQILPDMCGSSLNGPITESSSGGTPNTAVFTLTGMSGPATSCHLIAHDLTDGTVAPVTSSSYDVIGSMSFSQQPTNLTAGGTFSPTITVVITPALADSFTLTVLSGTCNLTGTSTVTANGTTGVATFTGLGANGVPQLNCKLNLHDNTRPSLTDVASNNFNMLGSLAFTTQPSNVTSGSNFVPTVAVTTTPPLTDSITVTISGGTCPSLLTGTTTVTANGGGVASFIVMGAVTAGTACILTAVDNTNTSGAIGNVTSSPFNVTTGSAMSFSSQPGSIVSGNAFSPTVTVTVNPPAANVIQLSISGSSCPSGLVGSTSVGSNGATGLAIFTGLGAVNAGSACTLVAHNVTNPSIADITSNLFDVTAPPLGPVVVTGTIYGATNGYVQFILQPQSVGTQFFVKGVATIAPQTTTCSINSSGQVVSMFSGPCLVWGNDVLTPANTTYTVVFAPGNVITNRVARELISGLTYSLNAPVFAPVVALVPQYNTLTTPNVAQNIMPAANNAFNLGSVNFNYAAGYITNLFSTSIVTQNISINGTATFASLTVGALSAGTIGASQIVTNTENITQALNTASLILPNNATPPTTVTGETIMYTDNTGVAKICQNGSPCQNLISGAGSSGWTYVSPTVLLNTPTDRVVVGAAAVGDFITAPAFNGAVVSTGGFYATNGGTVNTSYIQMALTGGAAKINSGQTGSGGFFNLVLNTGGSSKIQMTPGGIDAFDLSSAGVLTLPAAPLGVPSGGTGVTSFVNTELVVGCVLSSVPKLCSTDAPGGSSLTWGIGSGILTITAAPGGVTSSVFNIVAPNMLTNSFGEQITAGTNFTDYALDIVRADLTRAWRFYGDGGLSSSTLLDKGLSTINVTNYWVANTQGGDGTVTVRNSAGSGTCNLVFQGGLFLSTTC